MAINSATGYISQTSNDDDLTPIHGVAIGANDVTVGHLSGDKKKWTPEVLEGAASTLVGKEIVVDHENRSAREVVGEVSNARFEEGKGIIYEGFIDDEDLARKIGHGWLEVSPRIFHSVDMEEKDGIFIPKKIYKIDNLSIVSRGASPSNSVDLGEHSELSAEELQSAFDDTPEGAVAEFQRREEELQPEDLPDVDFKDFLYGSAEAAYGATQKFGDDCNGVHEHTVNGSSYFAPCSSHDKLIKALKGEQGINQEEMSEPVVEEMILSDARTPDYESTETKSWGDIPADTLSYWVEALDYDDVEQTDDLTESQKSEIASHTLLGDSSADNIRELRFFPVVNAETGDLNRGALEAVRSGRGQSADIPEDTYSSAYSEAGRLLNDNFDTDVPVEFEGQEVDEMASKEDQKKRLAGQLSSWAEMTREQAFNLIDTLDPEGADSPMAIAVAAEKGLGVDSDEVLEFLQSNIDNESADDEDESASEVPFLNRMLK